MGCFIINQPLEEHMTLRIWPPVWLTIMAMLALVANLLTPCLRLPGAPFYLAGPILWAPALWIFWWAIHRFKKANTPHHPFTTPTSFVVSGPYKQSRNPMYVVAMMVMAGWCAVLGNPITLVFLWALKEVLYRFVIKGEEERLERIFGEAYLEYCRNTPRWI